MWKRTTGLLLLLPLAAITLLVLAACAHVVAQGLGVVPAFGLEEPTAAYFAAVLTDEDFWASLGVSLRTAALSALLSAVLGTALCAALAARRRRWALYLVRLPILVPHAVVALFTITLFSQTGLLARLAWAMGLIGEAGDFPQLLYTPQGWGVVLAYLWKEIPFVAYFTLALMVSVSATLGEAAENLGASPLRSFFTVTLPLSLPAIAKAGLIIFLFAFGGYELPLLLGATVPKALPVAAYQAYLDPELTRRPYAMAMFSVILLLSVAMAGLWGLAARGLERRLEGGRP